MKHNAWIVVALFGACLAALGWQGGRDFEIGFVQLERVINEYDKNAELSRRLTEELDARRAELEKDKERIEMKKEELQLLARDSQKYRDSLLEIQVEEFRLEARLKDLQRSLDSKKIEGWKELFRDISKAAESIAKQKGLRALLVVNRGELAGTNDQDIMSQISLRQVLYADETLDVTDEVLEMLNR
jgi:Skp family chaperone for outer membrane proteins